MTADDDLATRRVRRGARGPMSDVQVASPVASRPTESIEALAAVMEVALEEGDAYNDSGIRTMLEGLGDDSIIALIADAHARIETFSAPYKRGLDYLTYEVQRRLSARRLERGGPKDTSPIAIPHPRVDVRNEIEFEPYQIDVAQLEEAARGLGPDDRKCLLVEFPEQRVPEQIIPARVIPAHVQPQNTTTILAWCKRNDGSPAAKMARAAITRPIRREVTRIKPKAVQL